jgi:hypothetical protein
VAEKTTQGALERTNVLIVVSFGTNTYTQLSEIMSETEPAAYIYEKRIVPYADGWKEKTNTKHPRDFVSDEYFEEAYRNVRPLYEHE